MIIKLCANLNCKKRKARPYTHAHTHARTHISRCMFTCTGTVESADTMNECKDTYTYFTCTHARNRTGTQTHVVYFIFLDQDGAQCLSGSRLLGFFYNFSQAKHLMIG